MARYKYKSKYAGRRKKKPARYVSKQWASSKKGAGSQASQIMSLQRQMNAVKLSVRNNVQWSQYQYKPGVIVHSGNLLSPTPRVIHLVGPSAVAGQHDGWRRIFNSDEAVQDNIKWQGRSVGIEYQLSLGNAATASSPITFTTFFVSLRPKVAQNIQQETDFLATLTEGEHYVKNDMGSVQGSGMVFLNKSMFKIHHIDRGMIGAKTNFVSAATGEEGFTSTLKDNLHRRYVTLPFKHLLKGDGAGQEAHWSSLNYKTVPQASQIFMIVFANNYGDQTLDIAINALFTGRTTQ